MHVGVDVPDGLRDDRDGLLDLGMAPGFHYDGHAARSVLQYG